jgi:group I intron endonuclease
MVIYCIKNKENGKEYIGLTKRLLDSRWKQHINESLRKGSWEYNTPLGNAIKKYGKDNFEVFVLEVCKTETELKEKEIKLIFERKSLSKYGGYNLSEGGDGRLGYKLSEEVKNKIRLGNLGKKMSAESRSKMSIAAKIRSVGKPSPMQGKKHTEESLLKISESGKGRFHSEETRKKRSESMKAFFQNKMLLNLGIQNAK